ncbi:MAG: hypothetical protein HYX59_00125 [Elusimicrobia bacterium]|nr:hypothetical protein [Elusimicrobiota bacterium]
MITTLFLLLAVPSVRAAELPPLPGMPGAAVIASTSAAPAANVSVIAVETKPAPLLPPAVPARPKGTLDTAGEVARDLAVRVEYFENGQSYYRAYTKGSHTPEENKAFVKFLEDYENELGIAKRTHAILGVWLDKKSSIKDK